MPSISEQIVPPEAREHLASAAGIAISRPERPAVGGFAGARFSGVGMATRSRPASLWTAFALIMVALVLTSGRTLFDVFEMAKTRDDLAMSGVWADAVWCNVCVWVLIGLPLYGAMLGWPFCRAGVAAISAALIGLLAFLMRSGNHTLSPWLITILLCQIIGSALFFTPSCNAFFRAKAA